MGVTPEQYAARASACAAVDEVTRMKPIQINPLNIAAVDPIRIRLPTRIIEVPTVTHFDAAWMRLYTSGSRTSPMHPEISNNRPAAMIAIPIVSIIEAPPAEEFRQGQGADEAHHGPHQGNVE